jgi:hypothetical protein
MGKFAFIAFECDSGEPLAHAASLIIALAVADQIAAMRRSSS